MWFSHDRKLAAQLTVTELLRMRFYTAAYDRAQQQAGATREHLRASIPANVPPNRANHANTLFDLMHAARLVGRYKAMIRTLEELLNLARLTREEDDALVRADEIAGDTFMELALYNARRGDETNARAFLLAATRYLHAHDLTRVHRARIAEAILLYGQNQAAEASSILGGVLEVFSKDKKIDADWVYEAKAWRARAMIASGTEPFDNTLKGLLEELEKPPQGVRSRQHHLKVVRLKYMGYWLDRRFMKYWAHSNRLLRR